MKRVGASTVRTLGPHCGQACVSVKSRQATVAEALIVAVTSSIGMAYGVSAWR
jgi:hypothetical protein